MKPILTQSSMTQSSMTRGAIALTIAGSDSGGGAGIQADLKAMSAVGAYGASVITALTAQNTKDVRAILDIPADFIQTQLKTVLDDLDVKAIKIGMVSQIDIIEMLSTSLAEYAPHIPIILDPVMVAKSGAYLLQENAVDCLKTTLLPRAALLTPNLPEAALLLGRPMPTDKEDILTMGQELLALGPEAVLMKGGHFPNQDAGQTAEDNLCIDYLITKYSPPLALSAPRIHTKNTHGTGCTYSAAITGYLAQGYPLRQAVENAHTYLARAIQQSDLLKVGSGHGPVHHFHQFFDLK